MKKLVMSKAIRNKCIECAGDSPKEARQIMRDIEAGQLTFKDVKKK